MHPSSLHCPTCRSPLGREFARCGDSVLWCASCQMGWLPGTHAFDALLEAQEKHPDHQVYLFQQWDV
ncbi:hypothetical protein [Deinococcus roseus]|uniref:hypothetical protein n=1 Tax=Deinococcus roseus TaxID=392414 RepID=UPI0016693B8A|nr:hypothetical protein [Deinococcus roseus]